MVWYLMIYYDSIAWHCMLLQCWLRRAGCVSQDAYILHVIAERKIFIANHVVSGLLTLNIVFVITIIVTLILEREKLLATGPDFLRFST